MSYWLRVIGLPSWTASRLVTKEQVLKVMTRCRLLTTKPYKEFEVTIVSAYVSYIPAGPKYTTNYFHRRTWNQEVMVKLRNKILLFADWKEEDTILVEEWEQHCPQAEAKEEGQEEETPADEEPWEGQVIGESGGRSREDPQGNGSKKTDDEERGSEERKSAGRRRLQ